MAASEQSYVAWFVDYPATHERAGETVEVVPRAWAEAEVERLRTVLCELHRAVTEDDLSDADHARLIDAIAEAQHLAPHVPKPPSEDGF